MKAEKNLPLKEHDQQCFGDLSEAFDAFNQSAQKMKQMYSLLEQKIAYLTDELDKKNRELERANRLAALGQLAAGVAHEIRNPLGGIELCATVLGRELQSDRTKQDLIGNILEGVRRLNTIVVNLLTFTREQKIIMRDIYTKVLLQEVAEAVNAHARKNNVVIKQDVGLLETIRGDIDQLRQVFINLLLNAIEAMPQGGSVSIELSAQTDLRSRKSFSVIRFRDNGVGIAADDMDKIFQPFFTTKETGTGLGLAISYKIIEHHNGTITVDSKVGAGTEFSVYLPL